MKALWRICGLRSMDRLKLCTEQRIFSEHGGQSREHDFQRCIPFRLISEAKLGFWILAKLIHGCLEGNDGIGQRQVGNPMPGKLEQQLRARAGPRQNEADAFLSWRIELQGQSDPNCGAFASSEPSAEPIQSRFQCKQQWL